MIHSISFFFYHRVNKSSVKRDRHNTLKRIERDNEEVRSIRCYGYAIQGDWLSFDVVLRADLSWSSSWTLLTMSCLRLIILKGGGRPMWIWSATCVVFWIPHLNISLMAAQWCWSKAMIKYSLVWLRNSQTFLLGVNAKNVSHVDLKDTFITFVREGKQPCGRRAPLRSGVLPTAND